MNILISILIVLVVILLVGFLSWLLCFASSPIFCPGKKLLNERGYGIRYKGDKEEVPGISDFDSTESISVHPKIWVVFKKIGGIRIVIGRIIAMNDSKTYFQLTKDLPSSIHSSDFLKVMKEINATSI